MITSSSVLVLAAAFQIISGGDHGFYGDDPRTEERYHPILEQIPKHCWAPPTGTSPFKCCPLPRLFSDEALDSCGIPKPPQDLLQGPPPGAPRPPPPPPDRKCKHDRCLMRFTNLLNDDESFNFDKLRNFVDDWGNANSSYTDAISIAKETCIKEDSVVGDPHLCDYDKVFLCLKNTAVWNCKFREDLEECALLREHMEMCRPHLFQKIENLKSQ